MDLQEFWLSVLDYLYLPRYPSDLIRGMRLSASQATRLKLGVLGGMELPPIGGNEDRWKKVLEFLTHPDVSGWNAAFTIDQLKLVAKGCRGVELHDTCIILPLY